LDISRPWLADELAFWWLVSAFDVAIMSGAPVFFVWLDPSFQAHLGFVGLITHGRDRRYMIYDGALLREVVDRYMDEGRS
jgi:hypothetical protein